MPPVLVWPSAYLLTVLGIASITTHAEGVCMCPSLPCPLPLPQYPTVRLIKLGDDMLKYKPEATEITAENLRAFLGEFFDGKLSVS